MYMLERTCKYKVVWGILSFICFGIFSWGYRYEKDLLFEGYMNYPLQGIIMIVAFFAFIICFLIFLTLRAIQKDIAELLIFKDN